MLKIIILIFILSEFIPAQNFTAETRLIKSAYELGSKAEVEYKVTRGDSVIYSVIKNFDYDIPFGQAKCDREGNLIISNAIDGSIEIYDETGTRQSKIFLTGSPSVEYERALYFDILDNKIIAGLFDPSFKMSEIYIVSNNGGIIKKIELLEKLIGLVAASATGNYFAVSAYSSVENGISGKTYIYDSGGNLQSEVPEYFTAGEFLTNDKMFLGYTNRSVKLFERSNGELIESFSASDGRILSSKYYRGKIFVIKYAETKLINGEWIYLFPELTKIVDGKSIKIDAELPDKVKDVHWVEQTKSLAIKIDGAGLIEINQ